MVRVLYHSFFFKPKTGIILELSKNDYQKMIIIDSFPPFVHRHWRHKGWI